MRLQDIVGTAIRSTFRSKLRTSLTVVAIFIGAFTLTITSAIGTGVSSYINTQVAAVGTNNDLTVTKAEAAASAANAGPKKYDPSTGSTGGQTGRFGATVSQLTAADITTIRNTKGITNVQPTIRVSPDYIQYGSNGKYVLSVNPTFGAIKADLAAGSQLDGSTSANQLLLPTSYLGNLGFSSAKQAVGQPVTIGITDYAGVQHTVTATVVGVQNATLIGSAAIINPALSSNLSTTQSAGKPASIPVTYGSALATFAAGSTPAQVNAIKKSLTANGFTGQTVADQLGSFESVINIIVGVLDAFAVIALIAAGFGIVNTLLMSVQERTREIGLMKAMGMGGGRIYTLFSIEAIFIGFLGSAIGAVAAMGVGSVISRILARGVLSGLPGLQVLQFSPSAIATIIVVVMLIAFLAGTLPARRASRQNPIEALRYE